MFNGIIDPNLLIMNSVIEEREFYLQDNQQQIIKPYTILMEGFYELLLMFWNQNSLFPMH